MSAGDPLLYRDELGAGELERLFIGDLRVRAGHGNERIVEGRAVPFGAIADVRDSPDGRRYRETIGRGATDDVDPGSIRLEALFSTPRANHNTHDGAVLVGRGIEARSADDGLDMAFRISRTSAGDDALELARDGVLGGLSIVFRPVASRTRADGVVERTRIDIRRVALVERGAYADATVTAVRAAQEGTGMHCQHCGAALVAGQGHSCDGTRAAAAAATDAQRAQTATPAAPAPAPVATITPELERSIAAEVARQVDAERGQAERAVGAAVSRAGSPARVTRPEFLYGPGSGRSFFGDLWRASGLGGSDPEARERTIRHYRLLHDVDTLIQRQAGAELIARMELEASGESARAGEVLSTEIPGAYPNQYLPGLIVNRVLKGRPMGGFYQRFPITDGTPKIYPVVSTSTTVAAQGAEGSNPAASDFATTATTITPTFYGGEIKVSRQVLDGADPNTDVMIGTDLNEAYVQASEAVIRAAVEAGSTASGVTLTAATPQAGLVDLILNYFGNVFLPAEALFLPLLTLYGSWAKQADTTGRLLASFLGRGAQAYNSASAMTGAGMSGGWLEGADVIASWSSTAGTGAGVGGVAVAGRSSDFAILESNVADFRFTEGAEAPSAIRVGLWAYLVVGTRRGSRKATGA
jgi:Escherichia/Staphylococcus phage prohead protease